MLRDLRIPFHDRQSQDRHPHSHVHTFIQCTHTWMGVYSKSGFYRNMLFYIHLLWLKRAPPSVRCTWYDLESFSDHRCVSLHDHHRGMPEGRAEGPEKPAAWNYCSPLRPVFRKDNWASVESPPLYSPPPAKHPDSTDTAQFRAHRAASACSFALFLSQWFLPVGLPLSQHLEPTVLLEQSRSVSPPVDYAPFQLREGALCCSGSHLVKAGAEIKEEKAR